MNVRESAKKKSILLPMLLMLLAAGLVLGGLFGMKALALKGMNDFVNAMPLPTETVSAVVVEPTSWANEITAVGNVVIYKGVDITTEASGIVKKIEFDSGDPVEEGELLVSLGATTERAELQRLAAVAELAELTRSRREKLYKLKSISKSDLDATASEAKAAQAAVAAQAAKIAQKEIRAPFTGRVGIIQISVGQYLNPGHKIVSLTALDPVEFAFSVPERWQGQIEPGYQVDIRIESIPDRSFPGKIIVFEPRVNEVTREYRVNARLNNPEELLRPGQFGRVKLSLPGAREVLPIPRTAINYDSFGSSVFVVKEVEPDASMKSEGEENGDKPSAPKLTVEKRFIKTGESRGDYVVIDQGLEIGERVVTTGLFKLRNGQPIALDNENSPKTELDPKPEQI